MATRALIGYLNDDNTITTTYNHYDGYPENLGVALDKFYSTDAKAKEIANMGYVSYIDPETGDIEANNSDRPATIGDDDLISSLQFLKKEAEGVDYVYLFSPSITGGEWLTSKTNLRMELFVDAFLDNIRKDEEDTMQESYKSKWKKFLGENVVDETEFNFFNTILGDKYSDDEIQTYLKSDSFIEASRDDDMEMTADNASNWENEFFEFFDNTDI